MAITLQDLTKKFGDKTAVSVPDFSIPDGEILGLVGNNGAGKTTLFRLMLDLLKADSGRVLFSFGVADGIDPALSEEWKGHTGAYVNEGFLIDFLTPEEYFGFIAKVGGVEKGEAESILEGFAPFMNGEVMGQKKLIRDFSAGNKQKIGIIGAMLHKPSLIVLDEPFNFLDPSSQNHLKRVLTDYNAATGATILVSSHNLQHTVEISTRVALMENGAIIKDLDNKGRMAEAELENYFNG